LRDGSTAPVISRSFAPDDPDDPFRVPEDRCPKCIALLTGVRAESCPHCGLVFAIGQDSDYRPPSPLSEEWVQLLSNWNVAAAHDAFVAKAAFQNELASVGRLYRLRLATAPGDPVAQRGRDEVLRLAAAPTLVVPRTYPSEAPPRRWPIWLALAAGVVVLVSAVVFMLRLLNQAPRLP
jgi:hypothetical protein